MPDALHLLFGVHNHQPVGNFDSVIADAVGRAYDPFLRVVRDTDAVRLTVHCSGGLLQFMREHARPTFDLLGRLAADERVELLTGGLYEPILPMLPDWDKVGQIQALTAFLQGEFGVRPRGMWMAERVWEPGLPRVLAEAGVEFVLLDDTHFALSGLQSEALGGYYLTEDQGARVAVFPISQRLRYLVPFADPGEAVSYLEGRRDAGAVTLVDDGEKFGIWPGTDRLVYGERWLARFFEQALGTPWLRLDTFSRYLDAVPPEGAVYLPAASYAEMGDWALPAATALELEAAREQLTALPDGARLARFLRSGHWRNFLVKYPEMGDTYWKMLHLSRRVQAGLATSPDDARLRAARDRLWQAQANDVYWHGVFGGCYLPHLRRAAKSALLACQAILGPEEGPPASRAADVNADGRVEVRVETGQLSVLVNPDRGLTVTELGWLDAGLDVADVLTRRREAYHARVREPAAAGGAGPRSIHDAAGAREAGLSALLAEDPHRRASLVDGLFPAGDPLDPVAPWPAALATLGDRRLRHHVSQVGGDVEVRAEPADLADVPLEVVKSVLVRSDAPSMRARYRLRWRGPEPLVARWGVQWNLTLTAGDADGRYYAVPGRPSLGSRGRLPEASRLVMIDEWLDGGLGLDWTLPAEAAWGPVETVSLSEAGYERIYQGSAILLSWPLHLARGDTWEVGVDVCLTRPARILLESI